MCDQLAEYAAHRRVCPDCGMLQPLKDRRTRRLQTLFGTVESCMGMARSRASDEGSGKNLGRVACLAMADRPD